MSSQRPKLSLKTSDLAPTYVASTTGRNDANAHTTATPTTLNTFNNTFDLTYRPSPVSTIPSPGPSLLRRSTNLQPSSPYALNLPFGVYPILKNSPLLPDLRRSSLATASASPRTNGRRMFFPAPKRVSFKPVLEEEIVTKEYVARHADLTSSSDEDTASSESEESLQRLDNPGDEGKHRFIRVDELSSPGRNKRKTRATSNAGVGTEGRGRHERSRSTSERRTKRKTRKWEWTIPGSLTKSADDSPGIKDGSHQKPEGAQTGEDS
ncbi:uncharacterized protein A1O9_05477 [Exophiala aquamarina CBS 119918]|uniref:Uncharacterized protein n=1 Tax=Exophiala aquamarina CBS 119918 TaxID=1182545 RepID=A0A072PBR3_9EURO|nr:uncharacterized protein A1O9_05477 [Exophiala aquamarina CBS 119918]KEF57559.1 hypothetical protein A1O9_05477 [Exophiala aquamarina CBS 119918]